MASVKDYAILYPARGGVSVMGGGAVSGGDTLVAAGVHAHDGPSHSGQLPHSTLSDVTADDHHDELHAAAHAAAAADELLVEDLATAETDTALVASPDGTGGMTFRAEAGGFVPTTDEFTATGATPETFTLSATPLYARRVFLDGARLVAAAVGGSGTSVDVNTVAGQEVIVDYEAAP